MDEMNFWVVVHAGGQDGSGGLPSEVCVRGGGSSEDGARRQSLRPLSGRPFGSGDGHRDPLAERHPAQRPAGRSGRLLPRLSSKSIVSRL